MAGVQSVASRPVPGQKFSLLTFMRPVRVCSGRKGNSANRDMLVGRNVLSTAEPRPLPGPLYVIMPSQADAPLHSGALHPASMKI